MNETPKRIYLTEGIDIQWSEYRRYEDDIPYIRKDEYDKLLQALKVYAKPNITTRVSSPNIVEVFELAFDEWLPIGTTAQKTLDSIESPENY